MSDSAAWAAPVPIPALVRVMIVDHQQMVTEGLRLLLDAHPGIRVVGEAHTLEAALAAAMEPDPDVVVADLVLGPARAAEMVTSLQERFPAGAVLVVTVVEDATVARSVLSAGARGYVPKAAAGADLVDAVRRVARGEDYLHHTVGVALARGQVGRGLAPVYLSERELAVARLLALGHTNAEVAELLYLSVRTIETHRAQVFRKLGVHTRAELVRAAARAGLVDLSSPPPGA